MVVIDLVSSSSFDSSTGNGSDSNSNDDDGSESSGATLYWVGTFETGEFCESPFGFDDCNDSSCESLGADTWYQERSVRPTKKMKTRKNNQKLKARAPTVEDAEDASSAAPPPIRKSSRRAAAAANKRKATTSATTSPAKENGENDSNKVAQNRPSRASSGQAVKRGRPTSQTARPTVDVDLANAAALGSNILSSTSAVQALLQGVPDQNATATDWANFLRVDSSVYGAQTHINLMTTARTGNEKEKMNVFRYFMEVLAAHPIFHPLAAEVVNPANGTRTFKFIDILRGEKTPDKKELLNSTFIVFGENYVKVEFRKKLQGKSLADLSEEERANAQYEPKVAGKAYRHIFKILKDNGVAFVQKDFTSYPGSYLKFWSETMARTQQLRPHDYAVGKNRAVEELQDEEKIVDAINQGKLNPLHNYDDNLMILTYKLMRDINFRSGHEPADLLASQLVFDIVPSGPYEGHRRCGLKFFDNNDKKHKLSFTNTERRDSDDANDFIEDPNDPYCTFACLMRHLAEFPDGYENAIMVRAAPDKVLRARTKNGGSRKLRAHFEETLCSRTKVMKPAGKFGKNYPNDMCKRLGEICKFAEGSGKKFTGRSARKTAISKMADNNVAPVEMIANSRHSSLSMNAHYSVRTEQTKARRYSTMLNEGGPKVPPATAAPTAAGQLGQTDRPSFGGGYAPSRRGPTIPRSQASQGMNIPLGRANIPPPGRANGPPGHMNGQLQHNGVPPGRASVPPGRANGPPGHMNGQFQHNGAPLRRQLPTQHQAGPHLGTAPAATMPQQPVQRPVQQPVQQPVQYGGYGAPVAAYGQSGYPQVVHPFGAAAQPVSYLTFPPTGYHAAPPHFATAPPQFAAAPPQYPAAAPPQYAAAAAPPQWAAAAPAPPHYATVAPPRQWAAAAPGAPPHYATAAPLQHAAPGENAEQDYEYDDYEYDESGGYYDDQGQNGGYGAPYNHNGQYFEHNHPYDGDY